MTNIIQFGPQRQRGEATHGPAKVAEAPSSAALCASARDTFDLLIEQLDLAIVHARVIAPQIRDPNVRREFTAQVEHTQQLLQVAHLKIRQL